MEVEEHYINVQKRIGDEAYYEDINVITDREQVQKVKQIINKIEWKIGVKLKMDRPADYRFTFQYTNPEVKEHERLYEIWLNPYKDRLQLIIDSESKYAIADKINSAELFEILTGEKLSDQ
ncbi:MAG: putative Lipoprotein [Candidatus Carbobacillus altaicus]|uniref:Putative Lipoprotein n=1 Tax=Candidatus Carbonibacillus altaicus TaxID=2163959 RepID=A0A2R6XXL1_9BACL|nr:MAG: putative Lipoprotein [Candidatus Carbobacillus altaicus]